MEKHLALLRDEHLQLQLKYSQLQKEYDVLEASVRSSKTLDSSRSFVAKLISNVAHLYDKDLYSDITIHCDGHQLRGHRFLIATRTDYWGDLSLLDKIDLEGTYT
ncbi:hypothetical protein AB6A40_007902 [Gnathostoma spinigerum]|uniref:BTB domain-containing protein n=1 Tax=Gnathostoma spinigerum TaxID=75299 RepID=A0ABD6EVV7_9BILA